MVAYSLLHINQSQTATISKDYQYNCRVVIWDHTGFVCYDDGCHLRKFARNPSRSSLTATASRIADLEIVIYRMHFKGHVDSWCKQTCNPDNFIELNDLRLAGSILKLWSQILTPDGFCIEVTLFSVAVLV